MTAFPNTVTITETTTELATRYGVYEYSTDVVLREIFKEKSKEEFGLGRSMPLPRNCVFFDINERNAIFVIELRPASFLIHTDRQRRAGGYKVRMPWQYFVFALSKSVYDTNAWGLNQVHLWWAKKKIDSLDEYNVIVARLPNVSQNHGEICLGTATIDYSLPLNERIDTYIQTFFSVVFSHDYGWNIPNNYRSFVEWERRSKDQFDYLTWGEWTDDYSFRRYNLLSEVYRDYKRGLFTGSTNSNPTPDATTFRTLFNLINNNIPTTRVAAPREVTSPLDAIREQLIAGSSVDNQKLLYQIHKLFTEVIKNRTYNPYSNVDTTEDRPATTDEILNTIRGVNRVWYTGGHHENIREPEVLEFTLSRVSEPPIEDNNDEVANTLIDQRHLQSFHQVADALHEILDRSTRSAESAAARSIMTQDQYIRWAQHVIRDDGIAIEDIAQTPEVTFTVNIDEI